MARKKKPIRSALSEAQLEIMHVIWDQKEATVSEVRRHLRESRPIARNTVQTMMARLENRGWLRHRRSGNAFIYSAAADRTTTLHRIVASLVETAFRGSAEDMVMALLHGQGVSPAEADRIRTMIEEVKRDRS